MSGSRFLSTLREVAGAEARDGKGWLAGGRPPFVDVDARARWRPAQEVRTKIRCGWCGRAAEEWSAQWNRAIYRRWRAAGATEKHTNAARSPLETKLRWRSITTRRLCTIQTEIPYITEGKYCSMTLQFIVVLELNRLQIEAQSNHEHPHFAAATFALVLTLMLTLEKSRPLVVRGVRQS